MTLEEMTADIETCRTKLSQIQDELIRLLDAPNIAVKSSLFGAAAQCKSAVHMTSCLLESLEAYGQIVRHLSD